MSKSLVQMVNELFARVAALEAKVKEQREPVVTITPVGVEMLEKPSRQMCPKCGIKPNHFFHVKYCRGTQKEEKQDADDQRRDSSKA